MNHKKATLLRKLRSVEQTVSIDIDMGPELQVAINQGTLWCDRISIRGNTSYGEGTPSLVDQVSEQLKSITFVPKNNLAGNEDEIAIVEDAVEVFADNLDPTKSVNKCQRYGMEIKVTTSNSIDCPFYEDTATTLEKLPKVALQNGSDYSVSLTVTLKPDPDGKETWYVTSER